MRSATTKSIVKKFGKIRQSATLLSEKFDPGTTIWNNFARTWGPAKCGNGTKGALRTAAAAAFRRRVAAETLVGVGGVVVDSSFGHQRSALQNAVAKEGSRCNEVQQIYLL